MLECAGFCAAHIFQKILCMFFQSDVFGVGAFYVAIVGSPPVNIFHQLLSSVVKQQLDNGRVLIFKLLWREYGIVNLTSLRKLFAIIWGCRVLEFIKVLVNQIQHAQ